MDEPGGSAGGIRVCEPPLLLVAKRVQASGTLSGRTTLDFATEPGIRIRFVHSEIPDVISVISNWARNLSGLPASNQICIAWSVSLPNPNDRDARVRSSLRLCPAVRVGLDRAGWTADSRGAVVAGRRGPGRAGPHASGAGHAGSGIGFAVQRCLLVLLWQATRRGGAEPALPHCAGTRLLRPQDGNHVYPIRRADLVDLQVRSRP